ncbi:MAG: hypothetical protein RBJ76_08830 [Stenomitos frigidus ULC029]
MLILILVLVIMLVAWSLHLMQQAVDRDEFSLMLAGTLVAFSAAAMVVVYFLMGNYIGYVTATAPIATSRNAAAWVLEADGSELSTNAFLSDSLTTIVFPVGEPKPL